MAVDPVCGMTVNPDRAAGTVDHDGTTYNFCSKSCVARFQADPKKYLAGTRERLVSDEVGNEWAEGIARASHLKLDALFTVLGFQGSVRHACRPFPWDGRTGERTLQPRRAVTTVEVAEPCDGHDDDAASHPVHDSS